MSGMISDRDIWQAANLIIKRHGAEAAIPAALPADELLADGDGGHRYVAGDHPRDR